MAGAFGASGEIDAFYLSFGIVQTAHDLLFVGSLGATIVPLLHTFGAERADSLPARRRFVVTATMLVGLVATALAIIVWAMMPTLVKVCAPGLSEAVATDVIHFGTSLVWLLPATALTTLFALVLNAHGKFVLAASAYLINNSVFCILVLVFAPGMGARILPLASVAGLLLAIPILAVRLARMNLLAPVWPDLSRSFFSGLWRLARMPLLSLGIGSTSGLLMVSHLIIRGYAADYPEGSIAALGYAFRIYEVPLSLIANPVATLILPIVASLHVAGEVEQIGRLSSQILLWGLVLLFPAAMITWLNADLIVTLLLRHGNFDGDAVSVTAAALRAFAPAVMSEAVFVVFFRFFYALQKPGRTVGVSLATLGALLLLLPVTAPTAFVAIPLCLSAAFTLAAGMLVSLLVHDVGWNALPKFSEITRWVVCALLSSTVGKLALWGQASAYPWSQMTASALFILVYFSSVVLLLPDCQRVVFVAAKKIMRRRSGVGEA
ncbi:murein biosynthesis integral membrane protein MurJ [Bradyrhizobium sp. CCBAU 53415]|uniref:murein biosynthesis integral membrane protein MurJ n=1 Tax=Bradyrhizobium sp. CCBAU 53415 TaxID=1325119 RepID=UPI00230524E5|nr:lipid II flippase MurJ [Bradyrhizobium sp. CCBAU 53415]